MTKKIIPVETFDYVVIGASGDLSRRKLLPALYYRDLDHQLPDGARIIGASRHLDGEKSFGDFVTRALRDNVTGDHLDNDVLARFINRLDYQELDVDNSDDWLQLKNKLRNDGQVKAFYLATPPALFETICNHIDAAGIIDDDTRVVIEKPLGHDLASATKINNAVGQVFNERQIFRIDHYLGKETVQNLLALRFANSFLEPLWNSAHIDHVQITVAEAVGVSGRASYYDNAGALRDMVQNHIIQLLCLVAMEPPISADADDIRDEKVKVLRSMVPINDKNINKLTVRGQYQANINTGFDDELGYIDELQRDGGNTGSTTETFVAINAAIDNWRWSGVPFFLRTGKRLAKRMSEIVIQFRDVPHSIFPPVAGRLNANRLVLRLQPNESVKLMIMIKDPGPGGMVITEVPLDLVFNETFSDRYPDAYERLLLDVIRGNQTLFMRRDEVEMAWKWIDPIIEAWQRQGTEPLRGYRIGSWGPDAAIALIEREGRSWYES